LRHYNERRQSYWHFNWQIRASWNGFILSSENLLPWVRKHEITWPQNCVRCGEELQSARDLTTHKIHCRQVFACKYCVLTCSSETELKEHIAIHKAETRQCNYCDAYFDDLADLNDHLTMHTNSVFWYLNKRYHTFYSTCSLCLGSC